MAEENTFVVDFVAIGASSDEWIMVLIESDEWSGDITDRLYKIQDRLYQSLDAALDGQLAEKFPESKGKKVIVQLSCYDVPKNKIQTEIVEFFTKFSELVLSLPDYSKAVENAEFVKDIGFKIDFIEPDS